MKTPVNISGGGHCWENCLFCTFCLEEDQERSGRGPPAIHITFRQKMLCCGSVEDDEHLRGESSPIQEPVDSQEHNVQQRRSVTLEDFDCTNLLVKSKPASVSISLSCNCIITAKGRCIFNISSCCADDEACFETLVS